MKVLMINGSPHLNGNTSIALKEMEKTFAELGIEIEIINLGTQAVRGCIACYKCKDLWSAAKRNNYAHKLHQINNSFIAPTP